MSLKNSFIKKVAKCQQRFSLRKVTVGVVSVLLGTTIWLNNSAQITHADELKDNADNIAVTKQQKSQNDASKANDNNSDTTNELTASEVKENTDSVENKQESIANNDSAKNGGEDGTTSTNPVTESNKKTAATQEADPTEEVGAVKFHAYQSYGDGASTGLDNIDWDIPYTKNDDGTYKVIQLNDDYKDKLISTIEKDLDGENFGMTKSQLSFRDINDHVVTEVDPNKLSNKAANTDIFLAWDAMPYGAEIKTNQKQLDENPVVIKNNESKNFTWKPTKVDSGFLGNWVTDNPLQIMQEVAPNFSNNINVAYFSNGYDISPDEAKKLYDLADITYIDDGNEVEGHIIPLDIYGTTVKDIDKLSDLVKQYGDAPLNSDSDEFSNLESELAEDGLQIVSSDSDFPTQRYFSSSTSEYSLMPEYDAEGNIQPGKYAGRFISGSSYDEDGNTIYTLYYQSLDPNYTGKLSPLYFYVSAASGGGSLGFMTMPIKNLVTAKASLKVIDETTNNRLGNVYKDSGDPDTSITFSDATADINNYLNNGYVFDKATNDADDTDSVASVDDGKINWQLPKFDDDSYSDQSFTVYLKHNIVPITPDKPSYGLTHDDLNKEVTRTITYRGTSDNGQTYTPVNGSPDGTSTYVQKAYFTRTAIYDEVEKKILGYDTNGDGKVDVAPENGDNAWVATKDVNGNPSNEFSAVNSKLPKEVDYDSVDIPIISAITVNADSQPISMIVTYKKDISAVPTQPVPSIPPTGPAQPTQPASSPDSNVAQPTQPTEPVASNISQASQPTQLTSHKKHSKVSHLVKNKDWNNNINPHAEIGRQINSKNARPNAEKIKNTNFVPKGQDIQNVKSTNHVKEDKLPQAGNNDTKNKVATAIGLVAVGLSIIGVAEEKKRRNN